MTAQAAQIDPAYLRGTSIPTSLLGDANTMDRVADSGFYYLYSPGLAIHRVQQQDGCPHIYPARTKCVHDFAKWYAEKMAAQTSAVGNRTTRDITGKSQMEILNAEYAGSIVASILDGETGWGRKAVVKLEAFSQRKPADIDIDYFNDLIAPYPIVFTRTDPNARYDDVDPRLKPVLADISEAIFQEVREKGALEVRRRFVVEAREKLESRTLGIASSLTELYLAAIREILPSYDLFRQWGHAVLNAKDKVVGGSQGKVAYDELDNELQWNLARRGVDNSGQVEAKTPIVNVNMPEGFGQGQAVVQAADIARQPCVTCGEMIAVTARKCRYCNEPVAIVIAVGSNGSTDISPSIPVGAESVTVSDTDAGERIAAELAESDNERRRKLEEKQAEAKARNQNRR